MTCMRARRSSNFCQSRLLTAELAAIKRLKKRIIMGKTVLPLFLGCYFILAGNDDIHESLDEFESWPDPTTGFHGNR